MKKNKVYEEIINETREDIKTINKWIFKFIILAMAIVLLGLFIDEATLAGMGGVVGLMITPMFSTVNKREEMIYEWKIKSKID